MGLVRGASYGGGAFAMRNFAYEGVKQKQNEGRRRK
jgi:hypothetical protein